MNCSNCLLPVPKNANFCPNCGQKIISDQKKTNTKRSPDNKKLTVLAKSSNAYTLILITVLVAFIAVVLILNSNRTEKAENNTNIKSNALNIPDEIKVLDEKLAKNPESLALNIEMGNRLFDTGQFRESIQYYGKALDEDPLNVAVQIDLAVCYFNLREFDKAIAEMNKALQLDPKHRKGLFNMGVIYLNMGDLEKAKKYWDQLKILYPESNESQRAQEILSSM